MSDCDSFDDDDDYGILKKALNVELPPDFNPNKIPQTGEEYLQHVMYERTKCKTWVTANIDVSKFHKKQTFKIEIDNSIVSSSNAIIPSLEWQTQKIDDFTLFRKFLSTKIQNGSNTLALNEDEFLQEMQHVPPKFSRMVLYSQASKIRMLQIISKHIEALDRIEENIGSWIYAILALLEKPLSPSSCHSLREFAKRCLLLRSKLECGVSDEVCAPLNLFICIVARFYNQLDLADE